MRLIRVAVPVPALEALTYHVPESSAIRSIGARVLVPLGTRTLTGSRDRDRAGIRDPGSGDPRADIVNAAGSPDPDRTPDPD